MLELNINAIVHQYDKKQTLNGVSFRLEEGNIGCLMGPSGSGKTTVLLCIAGLERIGGGDIHLGGSLLSNGARHVAPEKRRIGMVFQDFALFPHLSVRDNIGFGLRELSATERQRRIAEMLELCNLAELAAAFPHELSGGEQQRIALARALATKPDLLLLDEPFSRLDAALHEKLIRQVRDILNIRRQTALMVTHNQNEAFMFADIGGVINAGAICQWASMDELYHRPNCTFVARFVGDGALLSGTLRADGAVDSVLGVLRGDGVSSNPLVRAGDPVKVLLRPDDIVFDAEAGVAAVIERRLFRGSTTLYSLRLDNGEEVLSVSPSHALYDPQHRVGVRARPGNLILFPALSD